MLANNVETDVGPVRAISLARALVSRGEGAPSQSARLRGFPTTLPNGDQVLLPGYRTNALLLRDFRE